MQARFISRTRRKRGLEEREACWYNVEMIRPLRWGLEGYTDGMKNDRRAGTHVEEHSGGASKGASGGRMVWIGP